MKTKKQTNEGFGDNRINIPVDLSLKNGSVAQIIKQNIEKFNACSSKEEVIDLCHKLFDEAKLDTPWTKKFFYTLGQKKSYVDALQYVVNCYLKGAGLGMANGKYMHEEDDNKEDDQEQTNESMDDAQKEEFKKKLREGAVKFVYKKVDGTERTANGTLDPKLMDAPEKFKDKTSDDIDKASDK